MCGNDSVLFSAAFWLQQATNLCWVGSVLVCDDTVLQAIVLFFYILFHMTLAVLLPSHLQCV